MKKKPNKPIREEEKGKETSKDLPYDPNINSDDKQVLHDKDLSMDQDQDKPLTERDEPVDFTGEEMDIPGSEESDTTDEGTDIPDEENLQFDKRGISRKKKDDGTQTIPDPDSDRS